MPRFYNYITIVKKHLPKILKDNNSIKEIEEWYRKIDEDDGSLKELEKIGKAIRKKFEVKGLIKLFLDEDLIRGNNRKTIVMAIAYTLTEIGTANKLRTFILDNPK